MTDVDQLAVRFEEYLRDHDLKLTRQRRVIAQVFFSTAEGHHTLSELLEAARKVKPSIGYATVYRTMRLMTEAGVALEHKFADNGEAVFEPNIEGDHHDHIICLSCGQIIEFEDEVIEERQELVAKKYGFEVRRHRHEIYADCVRTGCEHRP